MDSPDLPRDTSVNVSLVARLLLSPSAQMWAERVFIAGNYFAWKSSDAVREEFSNAYPDREVLSKNIIMLTVRMHVKKVKLFL
jgi:hypothetical protein